MRRRASGANPPGPDPLVSHLRARPSSAQAVPRDFVSLPMSSPGSAPGFFFLFISFLSSFFRCHIHRVKASRHFCQATQYCEAFTESRTFQTKWGQFCVPVQVDDKTVAT